MTYPQPEVLINSRFLLLPKVQSWGKVQEQTLSWIQPKRWQNDYILRSPDQLLGALHYEENHFIRQGFAKTSKAEWHFKYTRFSLPKVVIQNNHELIAQLIFEPNWGWRGTLILPERQICWKSIDETENEYGFFSPEGYSLVLIRPRIGFLKYEAEVEIASGASHSPLTPLLTMLGWFLVLLQLR